MMMIVLIEAAPSCTLMVPQELHPTGCTGVETTPSRKKRTNRERTQGKRETGQIRDRECVCASVRVIVVCVCIFVCVCMSRSKDKTRVVQSKNNSTLMINAWGRKLITENVRCHPSREWFAWFPRVKEKNPPA